MKKIVLIETILLLSIGGLAISEGLRLILYKDPNMLYDMLGPGSYILVLGITIIIAGVAHFLENRKTPQRSQEKVVVSGEMRFRVISMVLVLGAYVFLINLVGYAVATIAFFLLTFRIVGIKSWTTNGILSLALTAVYYLIFVHYCGMVFPEGFFFNRFLTR